MTKAVFVTLLMCLGVLAGITLATIVPTPQKRAPIEWLDNPRSLQQFTLEGIEGAVNNDSLTGQWTVLLFGFLHCADVCPTNLSQLAALEKQLSRSAVGGTIHYVFVSVDPQRDSVAAVDDYAKHFAASIRGVTGNADELERLAADLGVQFNVIDDDENYTVSHSVTYSLIGPEGDLRARFRPGFDAGGLASAITAALNQAATSNGRRS